jgi:hypothetical protein
MAHAYQQPEEEYDYWTIAKYLTLAAGTAAFAYLSFPTIQSFFSSENVDGVTTGITKAINDYVFPTATPLFSWKADQYNQYFGFPSPTTPPSLPSVRSLDDIVLLFDKAIKGNFDDKQIFAAVLEKNYHLISAEDRGLLRSGMGLELKKQYLTLMKNGQFDKALEPSYLALKLFEQAVQDNPTDKYRENALNAELEYSYIASRQDSGFKSTGPWTSKLFQNRANIDDLSPGEKVKTHLQMAHALYDQAMSLPETDLEGKLEKLSQALRENESVGKLFHPSDTKTKLKWLSNHNTIIAEIARVRNSLAISAEKSAKSSPGLSPEKRLPAPSSTPRISR